MPRPVWSWLTLWQKEIWRDWPLTQQQPLFTLLGDPEASIGVQLTDSLLMIPNKSLSGSGLPQNTVSRAANGVTGRAALAGERRTIAACTPGSTGLRQMDDL